MNMKYTAAQKRLLEDQGTQFKFSTHAMGRTGLSMGPGKRFQGVTPKDKKKGVKPGKKKVIKTEVESEDQAEISQSAEELH